MAIKDHQTKSTSTLKKASAFALVPCIAIRMGEFTNRKLLLAFGCVISLISSLFLVHALSSPLQGDVMLYQGIAQDLFDGKLPYSDRVLEYPPYLIPIVCIPRLGGDNYLLGFMLISFALDWFIKCLLLVQGLQATKTFRGIFPVACYSFAVPFIHFFYLQRYDVWPALTCLFAIWCFCSNRYFFCGLAIAVGIGLKVYPVVFVLPLFILGLRRDGAKRFAIGLTTGLLPIVLLSFVLPWWRFAQFQNARGLQAESLYASILWMGHQLGLVQAEWVVVGTWYEVTGPWASAIVPWAFRLVIGGVGISALIASLAATRCKALSAAGLCRLLLFPLLAFVSLNFVFSPQYMIWLLPLAALASLEGKAWPMLAVPLATALTPIFFPTFEYGSGLNWFQTIVLLSRNLLLIGLWLFLGMEILRASLKSGISDQREPA